jgi:hypothetical protein
LLFCDYLTDVRFQSRTDCTDFGAGNEFALVSRYFFYFGGNALQVSDLPEELAKDITKGGAGFRRDYPTEKLKKLIAWLRKRHKTGRHGDPCGVRNVIHSRRVGE